MTAQQTQLLQTVQGAPSATASYTLSLSQTTQFGSAIVVFSYTGSGNASSTNENSSGVTDGAGNTYGAIVHSQSIFGSPTIPELDLYIARGTNPATQVTVSYHGGTFQKALIVREYTQAAIGVGLAEADANGSGAGTQSVTSALLSLDDAIMLGYGMCGVNSGTPTLTSTGSFGNFSSITITDGLSPHIVIFGISDLYLYNSAWTTQQLQMVTGGTSPLWALSITNMILRGGANAVGGLTEGMADGGQLQALYG